MGEGTNHALGQRLKTAGIALFLNHLFFAQFGKVHWPSARRLPHQEWDWISPFEWWLGWQRLPSTPCR